MTETPKAPWHYLALPHVTGVAPAPGEPLSEAGEGSLGYLVINDALSRSPTPQADLLRLWGKLQPETGVLALGLVLDQGPKPEDIKAWLGAAGPVTVCDEGRFNACHMMVLQRRAAPPLEPSTQRRKRALVFRPGGYGDGLCAASVFPGLHKEGYSITLLTLPNAAEAVRNNPYVDRILAYNPQRLQGEELPRMLVAHSALYDRFVNLNESYEHAVLVRISHQDDT